MHGHKFFGVVERREGGGSLFHCLINILCHSNRQVDPFISKRFTKSSRFLFYTVLSPGELMHSKAAGSSSENNEATFMSS